MTSDIRLRGILVATAVLAYAAAGISNVVLAFSPAVDAKHALAAACVMGLGIALTLFFGRQQDFMGGPLYKGQPVVLSFAAGIWISLVLAVAGGLYPIIGVGRFIPFMGYVGSIAFIPPVLAGVVMWGIDRLREGNRK